MKTVKVNRAPVLTLWAAIVAERLGFARAEALTLGRALAGLNAYSKGKALGLFQPSPQAVRVERRRKEKAAGVFHVDLMQRAVPVLRTEAGLRAAANGKPVDPASVERYLESKFGEALDPVTEAMRALAASRKPAALAREAYSLYEQFRPSVPAGTAGWGVKGTLSFAKLEALAE